MPGSTDDNNFDVPELIENIENGGNHDNDANSNNDDEEEAGWEEMDLSAVDAGVELICPGCQATLTGPQSLLDHVKQAHDWDLRRVLQQGKVIDNYDWIRLVNYVRIKKVTNLDEVFADPTWQNDEFLQPVLQDDYLLTIDMDDLRELLNLDDVTDLNNGSQESGGGGSSASQQRVRDLEAEVEFLKTTLATMRCTMRRIVDQPVSGHDEGQSGDQGSSQRTVGTLPSSAIDRHYFESYGHFGIHAEMLADDVRTRSYQDFILRNGASLFKGQVVLDVGCGTGILSMFAARAGATKVFAVDCADVAYQAMDIVRENGLEDRITVIKGKLEEIDLPIEKVDIIISEWMGYCLLYESMLDSIIYARDRFTSTTTPPRAPLLYPRLYSLYLVGCDDRGLRNKHLTFWEDVYGFRMSCMRAPVLREALITCLKSETVATQPALLAEFDLQTVTAKDTEMRRSIVLRATRDAEITCLTLYFDTEFDRDAEHKVFFSTSPEHTPTHWKQTVLLLDETVKLKKGEEVSAEIDIRRPKTDLRGLDIQLVLGSNKQSFTME